MSLSMHHRRMDSYATPYMVVKTSQYFEPTHNAMRRIKTNHHARYVFAGYSPIAVWLNRRYSRLP